MQRVVQWCGRMEVHQLVDEHISEEGPVVYTDSSVHYVDRSDCSSSARIKVKVIVVQSGANRSAISNMETEVPAITTAGK